MNPSLLLRVTGISVVAALGLAACGSDSNGNPTTGGSPSASSSCATGSVTGQGSTFQANIEKQWISDFAGQCSGANITYTGTGSGAGIQQFGSGTIDYAGSDATMKPDEQSAADKRCGNTALHIPVTAGGVAVIFNVKGVTSLNLSATTLAGIFDGSIKTWDAGAIKNDNPGVTIQFDSDSPRAAAARQQAYADAAKNGYLVGAAHISFPGLGRLRPASSGPGYVWLPVNYSTLK